jgi:hypothetical protein
MVYTMDNPIFVFKVSTKIKVLPMRIKLSTIHDDNKLGIIVEN